jgi:Rad3-related DNA helicase
MVIQACGRISRAPDDYGATYIYDRSFLKLLRQSESYGLVPDWWREAIFDVKESNRDVRKQGKSRVGTIRDYRVGEGYKFRGKKGS